MSELYDRIVGQRGSLTRLAMRLPGFEGYLDNRARRTADRLLRDYLADEVHKRIDRFVKTERTLLDSGGLRYMTATSSLKTRMQLLHDRVKAAAPGYSGFFAEIKITEEVMERLYAFDEAQLAYLDKFDEAITSLEGAAAGAAGVTEAIQVLGDLVDEAHQAFALREDVIIGLGKTG